MFALVVNQPAAPPPRPKKHMAQKSIYVHKHHAIANATLRAHAIAVVRCTSPCAHVSLPAQLAEHPRWHCSQRPIMHRIDSSACTVTPRCFTSNGTTDASLSSPDCYQIIMKSEASSPEFSLGCYRAVFPEPGGDIPHRQTQAISAVM